MLPFVINVLLLILLVTLYLNFFSDIFAFVTQPLGSLDVADPKGFLWHVLDGLLWLARNLLKVLFLLLSLVVIFAAVFFLSSLVNAPFYEAMAEKILVIQNAFQDRSFQAKVFLKELAHSIKISLYKIAVFMLFSLILFLLSLIPVLGIVFTILGFFFVAWFFAFELCTYPLVVENRNFREMLIWSSRRKMYLAGFGLPSLIPIVGLMILSVQVVGGTLLFLDLKEI